MNFVIVFLVMSPAWLQAYSHLLEAYVVVEYF